MMNSKQIILIHLITALISIPWTVLVALAFKLPWPSSWVPFIGTFMYLAAYTFVSICWEIDHD